MMCGVEHEIAPQPRTRVQHQVEEGREEYRVTISESVTCTGLMRVITVIAETMAMIVRK